MGDLLEELDTAGRRTQELAPLFWLYQCALFIHRQDCVAFSYCAVYVI